MNTITYPLTLRTKNGENNLSKVLIDFAIYKDDKLVATLYSGVKSRVEEVTYNLKKAELAIIKEDREMMNRLLDNNEERVLIGGRKYLKLEGATKGGKREPRIYSTTSGDITSTLLITELTTLDSKTKQSNAAILRGSISREVNTYIRENDLPLFPISRTITDLNNSSNGNFTSEESETILQVISSEEIAQLIRDEDEFISSYIISMDNDFDTEFYNYLYKEHGVPIVKEWIPYIKKRLIELNLLKELDIFSHKQENLDNIQAYEVKLVDIQLQKVISEGIQDMQIAFADYDDYSEEEEEEDSLFDKVSNISDYLMEFGGELGDVIQERFELGFDPNKDIHHPSLIELNLAANKKGVTGYYPPQANTMMGVANALQKNDFNFLIGEMGTGKTAMGAGLPYLTEAIAQGVEENPSPKRVIVMSPAIVVEKWAREVEERVPNAKVYIVKDWIDLKRIYDRDSYYDEDKKLRFKEPEQFEYYIFSSELPKTSIRHELNVLEYEPNEKHFAKVGGAMGSIRNQVIQRTDARFVCPSCGGTIEKKVKIEDRVRTVNLEKDFFYKFNEKKQEWVPAQRKRNQTCMNIVKKTAETETVCGHSFWKPEDDLSKGMRKVSPIWYLNKVFPRGFFKYLILDEAHEFKGGNSKLGESLGQLVNHTEKQILLTGTLMGGLSSDIYWLLAKLIPNRMKLDGIKYGEVTKFTSLYGVLERSDRSGKKTSAEKPGINPHLFPTYLMDSATFLELNDMGYALPKYEEHPVIVSMGDDLATSYHNFQNDFVKTIDSIPYEMKEGANYGFTLINSLYQYADIPMIQDSIELKNKGDILGTVEAPKIYDVGLEGESEDLDSLSKYQELLNILRQEIDNDRKNLIYVNYTGESSFNRVDTWMYEQLKREGFNVGILTTSGSYDGIKMPKRSTDRESWLKKMMEKHDWDILITSPRLVKVGLDLLDFPNIHFYQMGYSTYDYLQASRRSWRIRQDKPVKVYTYVYENTIQMNILEHMASKIDASLAVQGKLSEEGLRTLGESNGLNQLAKDLINNDIINSKDSVVDSFARKNQTFEEMQSVEFQEYEGYIMNPIEGGIDTIMKIAEERVFTDPKEFLIKEPKKVVPKKKKIVPSPIKVTTKKVQVIQKEQIITEAPVLEGDIQVEIVTKENIKDVNKGVRKSEKVAEGQLLFF